MIHLLQNCFKVSSKLQHKGFSCTHFKTLIKKLKKLKKNRAKNNSNMKTHTKQKKSYWYKSLKAQWAWN